MTSYDFIFSNKTNHRVTRHLMFWSLYCIYLWMQSINPMDYNEFFEASPYKYAFINLCCFIPVCILSVYLFLYILLPVFLQKKSYLLFSFAFFSWFSVAVFINYFFAGLFLNNIHYKNYIEPNFIHKLNFGYANTVWAITIALFALGIKLTKNWYRQQKENVEIAEKKARTELRLQKAFIQPEFLFRSLDSISTKIDSRSDEPGIMVLKLSDLLSYSLYQDDVDMVLLEKELAVLHDFISLEQKNLDSFFDIDVQVNGDTDNKYVPPMIILALMQESVTMLNHEDPSSHQLTIQINILKDYLSIKLSFINLNNKFLNHVNWKALIQNTTNRLNVCFSSEYQIQITEEEKETILMLNMPLSHDAFRKLELKTNHIFYEPS